VGLIIGIRAVCSDWAAEGRMVLMNMNDRFIAERPPGLFYRLFYLMINWLRDRAIRRDLGR